jgi:DNA-binding SARP family transcriptional activator
MTVARRPNGGGDPGLAPRAQVRVGLLTGFSVTADGVPIAIPTSVQRLVAFVALHERPIVRSHVAGVLWLDVSDERAMGNLRSALWRLHRLRVCLLETVGSDVGLACDVGVDLHDMMRAARRLLGGDLVEADAQTDELHSAGEVLPDWSDDWVLIERERFRQLRLHALERLCERFTEERAFGRAIDAGLAAVDTEPLRESAHRTLIRAYIAEGNPVEAIRQFRLFERLMYEELGLAPSIEMRDLMTGLPVDRAAPALAGGRR